MDDIDYTGVPMGQLRQQVLPFVGEGKKYSRRWLTEKTEINAREMARILDKAPGTAVLGLNKADRILHALRQNSTLLAMRGEIDVVPLGSSKVNASKMATDILEVQGLAVNDISVISLARTLLNEKREVLKSLASGPKEQECANAA